MSIPVRDFLKKLLGLTTVTVALSVFAGTAAAASVHGVEEDNEIWRSIRLALFKNDPITVDSNGSVIKLKSPVRAQDSAVVPIGIESKIEQTPDLSLIHI